LLALKSTFKFLGADTRLSQKSVHSAYFDFFVIGDNAAYAIAFLNNVAT